MALLFFQQCSMVYIGRHVGGHTLALQQGPKTTFSLDLVNV